MIANETEKNNFCVTVMMHSTVVSFKNMSYLKKILNCCL